MKRDKEFQKEFANPFPAKYCATLSAVGALDMIGVEGVKNLKILFPAPADVGGNDGGIQNLLPCVYIAIRVLERSQMLLSNH
jgi:hypothetical protein